MPDNIRYIMSGYGINEWCGCFYLNASNAANIGSGSGWMQLYVAMDASRSSNRYGNYTEVNPLYESTKYMIKY